MLRPLSRLRFRLTHAMWAGALALALGGMATFTPLHRLAFAESGGPAAAWVGGGATLAFSALAVWAAVVPESVDHPAAVAGVPARRVAGARFTQPRLAPLPAALWPLPPPVAA